MHRAIGLSFAICSLPLAAIAQAEPCKTGCAAIHTPVEQLDTEQIRDLLELAPHDADALDTLLFYGEQIRSHLGGAPFAGVAGASPGGEIGRELARTHAVWELRVIDQAGRERVGFEPTLVRLGHKHHTTATTASNVALPIASGTIKRVGLRHIWSRL